MHPIPPHDLTSWESPPPSKMGFSPLFGGILREFWGPPSPLRGAGRALPLWDPKNEQKDPKISLREGFCPSPSAGTPSLLIFGGGSKVTVKIWG